ncbi:YgiT-type zinc finger protein [Paenibacillus elgii]|uniref:YgiT-type zinc finger protein n=1 Tax=Paenibacillus elgii TaxID=189691 RepID=UPI00203B52CB|nr:YgiT-type zinc finger protein [Paenibacillus elgii]MCM3270869.1 YgiT-type zinc finger protein [Paenibacillus elgii]
MNEADKQELINLCLRLPCSECGKHEYEYAELDKVETINGKQITIPNVPMIRCKHCNAEGYPSFTYDYIDEYKANISH